MESQKARTDELADTEDKEAGECREPWDGEDEEAKGREPWGGEDKEANAEGMELRGSGDASWASLEVAALTGAEAEERHWHLNKEEYRLLCHH